jgi:hypothetical protein
MLQGLLLLLLLVLWLQLLVWLLLLAWWQCHFQQCHVAQHAGGG